MKGFRMTELPLGEWQALDIYRGSRRPRTEAQNQKSAEESLNNILK
jgi:hypothetical protein